MIYAVLCAFLGQTIVFAGSVRFLLKQVSDLTRTALTAQGQSAAAYELTPQEDYVPVQEGEHTLSIIGL